MAGSFSYHEKLSTVCKDLYTVQLECIKEGYLIGEPQAMQLPYIIIYIPLTVNVHIIIYKHMCMLPLYFNHACIYTIIYSDEVPVCLQGECSWYTNTIYHSIVHACMHSYT